MNVCECIAKLRGRREIVGRMHFLKNIAKVSYWTKLGHSNQLSMEDKDFANLLFYVKNKYNINIAKKHCI